MIFFRAILAASIVVSVAAKPSTYDPLAVGKKDVDSVTFELKDKAREREIPIRVYLPETEKAVPVVIFSHGLGGSRDNNPYLGNHWAKRGYVVVFVQHAGSDESVWKDVPALQRMAAMKKAASAEAFSDRVKDVPAVIDALENWNKEKSHALCGRMDLDHIGMSGHSFGAVTTQAMAGQSYGGGRITYLEKRIDAAVMMSPSKPRLGDVKTAFGGIEMPCLLLTGTKDDSPIGGGTPEDRLEVFPNLKKAPAWQAVFDGATHMDFGERKTILRKNKDSRYHEAILAQTTAFWDAQLKGDEAAGEWLNGAGAKKALDAKDKWEINAKARG
jgi:predicted dienelactone hydrolase